MRECRFKHDYVWIVYLYSVKEKTIKGVQECTRCETQKCIGCKVEAVVETIGSVISVHKIKVGKPSSVWDGV